MNARHAAVLAAAVLSLFDILPAQTPQAGAMPKFVISGILVQHRTNQPVKHARVTIAQNQRPDQQASLITADDGRFNFTDVPQGKYTLRAEVRGDTKTFQEDGFFSTGIVVGPGLDSEHIVFPFPAPTSISVKVTDDEGEPVRGAQLLLFARRIASGWPHVELVSQTATNGEGSNRFAHLEPGTYYVAAGGRPWYAQDPIVSEQIEADGVRKQVVATQSAAELEVAYPVTYYAGAPNPEAASPITIVEGDQTQVTITLRAVPAMKIAIDGFAQNENSARRQHAMASVEAVGPGGIRFPLQTSAYEIDGQEVVGGVAPGTYIVSVSRMTDGEGRPEPAGSARVAGNGEVKLSASDLAHTSVSGQVTAEKDVDLSGVFIGLVEPANGQNAFCRVAREGSFQCGRGRGQTGLPPGDYEIHLGNTRDLYPKSVAVKGATYAGGLLEVRDGTNAQISIVAAKGVTELSGIALHEGKGVSGAMVLLVPQDATSGIGIPRDQSDSDGTFTLPDVHPGRYLLLAVDNGHDFEYHNPRALAPYLASAQSVQIPLAHDAPVQVNVQHRLP